MFLCFERPWPGLWIAAVVGLKSRLRHLTVCAIQLNMTYLCFAFLCSLFCGLCLKNTLHTSSQPVFLSAPTSYTTFSSVWYSPLSLPYLSCLFPLPLSASSSSLYSATVVVTVSHVEALSWSTSKNTFRWSWPSVSPPPPPTCCS